jgi:hypothetical protein
LEDCGKLWQDCERLTGENITSAKIDIIFEATWEVYRLASDSGARAITGTHGRP